MPAHSTTAALLTSAFGLLLFSCTPTSVVKEDRSEAGGHYIRQSERAAGVIVFVHGIFGDQSDTWRNAGGQDWPSLIAADEDMASLDIYLVDYHTPYRGRTADIDEIATRLRDQLERRGVLEYPYIHVIAHSMGGLVTKALLLDLNSPRHIETLRRFKTASFLSTPALGAPIADVADWLSNNPQLGNMSAKDFNTFLGRLERQWQGLLRERDTAGAHWPRIYCAYEKQAVAGRILVVPRLYASTRCDDDPYPMETADHISIAKPDGVESDQYTWVKNHILASEDDERKLAAAAAPREERLVQIARDSADRMERARALEALDLPTPSGSPKPLDLGDNPIMSIFRMGERALSGSPDERRRLRDSVSAIAALMNDAGKPVRLRDECAHTLAKIGGDAASAALLAALASRDSPVEIRTTALHGPTRFWPSGMELEGFNVQARYIIHSWPAATCQGVTENLKFKYLEASIADAVVLCAHSDDATPSEAQPR